MSKLPKCLLTGDELNAQEIEHLLLSACMMKKNKQLNTKALNNKRVALLFEKLSLRTRFSFYVAIQQLGGQVLESIAETRKQEAPKDLIRVIQGYCDAVMIRTHSDNSLEEMRQFSGIPIINGLTEMFHPCQTLADLMTLQEHFRALAGLRICYIGDGNNVLHSLLLMATKMGVEVNYCCPDSYGPHISVLKMLAENGTADLARKFSEPKKAVEHCQAVYTDVWTSMGFDTKDETKFKGFQVDEKLMSFAAKEAVFMHCMPMIRGKEVSEELPDHACSVIFQQSENRLHVQKALLVNLFN